MSHIGGSGIGLTIVKRIKEDYGGQIWIESKLGMVQKFIFDSLNEFHSYNLDEIALKSDM